MSFWAGSGLTGFRLLEMVYRHRQFVINGQDSDIRIRATSCLPACWFYASIRRGDWEIAANANLQSYIEGKPIGVD